MTNLVELAFIITNLCLTNFVGQMEPSLTNPDYFTNFATNIVVSGEAEMRAIIGPAIQLQWTETTNTVLVQESIDLTEWADIRVRHFGTTNWWVLPLSQQKFYRLRFE